MNLVIIEGVGKQDTIKKYLGPNFEVVATKGHIRDLPEKTLGVNIIEKFKPQYEIMPDKEATVKMLQEKAKKADKIYLATDPDREGEAISWHLCHILNLDVNSPVRITFNEISKNAVNKGLENPRGIDIKLVNAQQARRVLDRLVGYKLSPILGKKIQPRLSAGRVQSVALKLVVDRENEIKKFVPTEYWTLNAELYPNESKKDIFKATLTKINNKKANIPNKEEMDKVLADVNAGVFQVKSVKKTLQKTSPQAPYTTSTMQQEALNKLGFNLKKASSCAQELYEGVNLGEEGKVALITYIRTDSVRVAPEAMAMAKKYIAETYGDKYVPNKPNVYKTKDSAQDAHEAIRPISLERTPEKVKQYLNPDNYKLYKLIYNKFVASQMAEATHNLVVAEIQNGNYNFKASGKTLVFDGYMAAFNSDKKVKKDVNEDDNEEGLNDKLPPLNEGDKLELEKLNPAQKFTKPPQRFTEATLVKEMEDKGIGRPATYTPTITLLASRKYTEKEGKYLKPTELGEKIHDLLEQYFSDVINIKFTANMESQLDEVAMHDINWQDMVDNFWKDFYKLLIACDKDSVKYKIPPKETDVICEKCGGKMVIRTGKYGEFLACSNFPKCGHIQNIFKEVGKCPKCGKPVTERKSKKGKIFYGCSGYPTCDFISWEIPTEFKCKKCGEYLTKKTVYGNTRYKCSNVNCDFTHTVKKPQESENQ